MMDATKYAPGYYPVPAGYDSWVKKDHIEKAPAWCSVDLRDGNQHEKMTTTEAEEFMKANIEALTSGEPGGGEVVKCYCKTGLFSGKICSTKGKGSYCGGNPCSNGDGNCR